MRVIQGVSAALVQDRKVLVVCRSKSDDFLAGYWELPGGKLEPGESHEQAVAGEMHEELSLKVKVIKNYHQFSYNPGPSTHCTDYQYLVKLANGEKIENLKLSFEHDSYKWVDREHLKELSPITPEAKNSVELALNS